MAEGDNKLLKILAIGCGAVLLLGCCIAGGVVYYFKSKSDAPANAAHSFFKDLRDGNQEKARRRMSGAYQGSHPIAAFQQSLAAVPALTQQSDATFANRNVSEGTASLSGTLKTSSGEAPVEVMLTEMNDAWYIESVSVNGTPLP